MPKEGHNPITCIAYKLYHYNKKIIDIQRLERKKKKKTPAVQATHKLSMDSKGVFYPTIPTNK